MRAIPIYKNERDDLWKYKKFVAAVTILAAKAPDYHMVFTNADVFWTSQVPTAATDGVYIYINPDFFLGLPTDAQRAFLLGHEVGHIVLNHPMRGRAHHLRGFISQGVPFVHKVYNYAGDAIINEDLISRGLEAIEGCILHDNVNRNDVTEEVYLKFFDAEKHDKPEPIGDSEVPDDVPTNPVESEGSTDQESEDGQDEQESQDGDDSTETQSGDGEEGDEQEQGEQGAGEPTNADESTETGSGLSGGQATDHDGHDVHLEPLYDGTAEEQEEAAKDDYEEIQRQIEQAIDSAEMQGQEASDVFKGASDRRKSDVDLEAQDWREQLEVEMTKPSREGNNDFRRIDRRKFANYGVIAPAKRGNIARIAAIKDISYSVCEYSEAVFDEKFAELIDQLAPTEGTLVMHTNHKMVQADNVYNGQEYADMSKPQGGGTYLSSALDWMNDNGYTADVIVAFTDGELDDRDWKQLAEAEVIVVLDTYSSYVYAKRYIKRHQIKVIVADDNFRGAA